VSEVRAAFGVLPIFEAPLLAEEPIGRPAFESFAQALFGDADPTQVFHVGPTQTIESSPTGYVLRVPMPNAELDRLSLTKRGDALYIDVGNVRREVTLPPTLAGLEPGQARFRRGTL